MTRYAVDVREISDYTIEVEAENPDAAELAAFDIFYSEDRERWHQQSEHELGNAKEIPSNA